MKKLHIFLISMLVSGWAQAQEFQYVSDQLIITLRTGQGSSYQILKTLPSGTRLEILEMTDTGYANVRTEDGTEGWIRSQYLIKEPIARLKLERAENRVERLKTQNKKLKEELGTLRKDKSALDKERTGLLKKTKDAESELARLSQVAAKPILLDKENRDLQQKNVALEKKLQILSQENQVLKDRSQREWFIAGAGVLLGGIILGLIVPKVRWKKKSSWS